MSCEVLDNAFSNARTLRQAYDRRGVQFPILPRRGCGALHDGLRIKADIVLTERERKAGKSIERPATTLKLAAEKPAPFRPAPSVGKPDEHLPGSKDEALFDHLTPSPPRQSASDYGQQMPAQVDGSRIAAKFYSPAARVFERSRFGRKTGCRTGLAEAALAR
jgi:hypothetical protein